MPENLINDVQTLTRPAEISFAKRDLQPPSSLYIDRDDSLLWAAQSQEVVGQQITLNARILRPTGEIIPQQYKLTVSALAFATIPIQLTEGWLLSLAVTASPNDITDGQVYTTVELFRSIYNNNGPSRRLIGGYLSQFGAQSWPEMEPRAPIEGRGFIRSDLQGNPAAGAEFSVTVDQNTRVRLISVTATLTASAAAANRVPSLVLDDGVDILGRFPAGTITALQAPTITWAAVGSQFGAAASGALVVPIPCEFAVLLEGFRIRSLTNAIDAGDQYSAVNVWTERWVAFQV